MKKTIFVISIALNLFFLISLFLVRRNLEPLARKFYFDLKSERRATFFSLFPVTSGDVVFLGDSITAGGCWSELFPGVTVRNRGIAADRTDHVLARVDQVVAGRPAKVFLKIGSNDLGSGFTIDEIVDNYRRILNAFQEGSPGTEVFVQSILPRQVEHRARVEALNRELLMLAKEFGYPFIDLYPAFLDDDGSIKDEYSNDELHLLGAGYWKWKELLEPFITSD